LPQEPRFSASMTMSRTRPREALLPTQTL